MAIPSDLLPSAVEAIGSTPLIDLARITRNYDGRILAKLEYLNPGFSKKDRIARQIITDAETSGELKPGQTVVELTSGNTGPEIIHQSGGDVDLFCDFAGTGGSFAGCAAALKEHNPKIKSFIIEPDGAAILAGEPVTYPNHRIQGGGYAMADLPLLDRGLIDGYLKVSDQQAINMARRLAKEEGIFAGFSSGANVAAALELLQTDFKGKTAVVLICDSGLKYLSTDLWYN